MVRSAESAWWLSGATLSSALADRAFPNATAEASALIYNWTPFYSGAKDDPEFEQVYFV